jgi:hypothetical protein
MLNLEIGRRYIRRNGTITPPLEPCGSSFFDPESCRFFSNHEFGNHVFGEMWTDADDLISEAQLQ